jgi:hypothetical protein
MSTLKIAVLYLLGCLMAGFYLSFQMHMKRAGPVADFFRWWGTLTASIFLIGLVVVVVFKLIAISPGV